MTITYYDIPLIHYITNQLIYTFYVPSQHGLGKKSFTSCALRYENLPLRQLKISNTQDGKSVSLLSLGLFGDLLAPLYP